MADGDAQVEENPSLAPANDIGPGHQPRLTPMPLGPEMERLRRELEQYRQKAVSLDVMVFELKALLQSGKGFSEILNVEALLKAVMAVCRERYNVKTSAVLLLDDLDAENVFYRVRACHGLPETFVEVSGAREEIMMFRIPKDEGLLWQLIQQGDVFSVTDMRGLPRFTTAWKRWHLDVLRSCVWVPLVRGEQVVGILTLGECADGTQVPEDQFTFLKEIASVAATNIDSALKYEKNERILKNLRTLYDVNQQLANVNDFKKLTIETLATAVQALRAQKANLMLLNPETQQLEIKVVWGNIPKMVRDDINDGRIVTRAFAIGEGVAGMAAKLKRPVRINDRAQIEQVGRNLVHCILSAPLIHGGHVMGVITLTNKVRDGEDGPELDLLGRFGEDDAQLLLGLADQAAVNLHKARLYSASITDRMTGLFNARHFETRFGELVEDALRGSSSLSLAVLDIDHFKQFNDRHGHKAGDEVLARVGQLIGANVRSADGDLAFRYGGEEFCILMPNTDGGRACEVVEGLRKLVESTPIEFDGKSLSVSISAGVATLPTDVETRAALFEFADRALYAAKSDGRNRVVRARPAA